MLKAICCGRSVFGNQNPVEVKCVAYPEENRLTPLYPFSFPDTPLIQSQNGLDTDAIPHGRLVVPIHPNSVTSAIGCAFT